MSDASVSAAQSAGALLRSAREAAGLSIHAVAQQLKLAPRQVQALEDNDFAQLPGRTFVRGFLRNYARLVRIDPDAVLASLDGNTAPSLVRPSLTPTTRVMGELPDELPGKPSNARWAIPLALAAIVAIAVAYEFARPLAEQGRKVFAGRIAPPTPAASPPPESPAIVVDPAPAAATSETPVPAADTTAAASVSAEVASVSAADAPIMFVFRGTSWVEVKDAKGNVLLSTMGYPGARHMVGGALPLDVVLGNAEAVSVTLRGEPFDTSAYTRQNVAKFTVK
jgi:cytoskeleton protein RodZ